MFGFGNKKKKIFTAFFDITKLVMSSYKLMRALSSNRMEDTGLDEEELKLFEAAYLFGVIDMIAHSIDVDEKTIRPLEIFDAAITFSSVFEIFPDDEARALFKKVKENNITGNSINNLMYLGAKDVQSAVNAILEGQDSRNINKAMGLKYLDDEELIEDFTANFDSYIW